MSGRPQVLQLEPSHELSFRGPFTEVVSSQLKLRNPTDRAVFFKVKTTAPRYYCVRPNSGVVRPNDVAVISVMLQPVDQAATLENERSRHKFMIQSAFAPDSDVPVDQFWKTADLSQVMDSKLKVQFVHPAGDDGGRSPHHQHTAANTTAHTAVAPSPQQRGDSFADQSAHTAYNSPTQQASLIRESEIRKRVEDDKANLERENRDLRMRLAKLDAAGQLQGQLPTWTIALVALAAILIGIILGKLF